MSNYKNTNHKYIILPLYIRLSSIAFIYKKHIHSRMYYTAELVTYIQNTHACTR